VNFLSFNTLINKLHVVKYNKTRVAPKVPVVLMIFCCYWTPWGWHFGTETSMAFNM